MERPLCELTGCGNVAEQRNGKDNSRYRRYCNTHRRRLNGRMNGWDRAALRKRAMLKGLGDSCQRCGISGPPGFLDIHHRDKNPRNNKIENLALLCPNCHRMEHLNHVQEEDAQH